MRLRTELRLLAGVLALAGSLTAAGPAAPWFAVLSEQPEAWVSIFSAIGLQQRPAALARVIVVRPDAPGAAGWRERVQAGAYLVLEGDSSTAQGFGFRAGREQIRATSVEDARRPNLRVVWEQPLEIPRFEVPPGARVFARERWTRAPLLAGFQLGAGGVLWTAVAPGPGGYERFPFLLHALADLGWEPGVRSNRLWAFFDSSYRLRADVDYLAARWARAGIAGLHVAAWHYFEPDAQQDPWLRALIAACHRQGILVYAWLELPHVSDRFWNEHPAWREKTAVLQDAHLDWRKLMNLANPECARAVRVGVEALTGRFDWDGVNLGEMYFESLEGLANPSRFTPFNDDVRRMFREARGFDPVELFGPRGDDASRRAFLDFRADLASRLEEQWLGVMQEISRPRPHLDVALTHVDDRFDAGMRDAVGADATRALRLLERYRFTFLIEDPATVWNQGPRRYREIARRYRELTPHPRSLGIDINIVERYQDVYPTRQQAGTELLQLVHAAAAAFDRVALYFESSILPEDGPLLSAAAGAGVSVEPAGSGLAVRSAHGVGIAWPGAAQVDGQAWPAAAGGVAWLPAGSHIVETAPDTPRPRILRFNGDLISSQYTEAGSIELAYRSSSRALALLDRRPARMTLDGTAFQAEWAGLATVLLPRGQHVATFEFP